MPLFPFTELFPEIPQIRIVDVGALALSDESAPYSGLVREGRALVVGFEPNREECDKLNQSHGTQHRFLPYFIGNGSPATFHITNHVMTGSLYEPNTPLLSAFQNLAELVTPVKTEPVQTHRLDDLSQEIPDCDWLKIDIQGAELSAFRGGEKLLTRISVIQTEVNFVPIYKQMPQFSEVDLYLRQHGFLFHKFQGLAGRAFKPFLQGGNVNMPLSQLLWADAVYVRDFQTFSRVSASKLLRLACVMHEVYESYDLAYKALEAYDGLTGASIGQRYLQKFGG